MADVYYNTFDAASATLITAHTPNTGSPPTKLAGGDYTVGAGTGICTSGPGGGTSSDIEFGVSVADCIVESNIRCGANGDRIVVWLRVQSNGTGYILLMEESQILLLYRNSGGGNDSITNLEGSGTLPSDIRSTFVNLKASVIGNELKVTVNGVTCARGTATNVSAAGKVQIQTRTDTTQWLMQDLRITDNAASGVTAPGATVGPTVSLIPGAASGPTASTGGGTDEEIVNNTGTVLASTAFARVVYLKLDGTVALNLASQTSDSSGKLIVSNAAFVAGTSYIRVLYNSDGTQAGAMKVTAS